MVSVKIRVRIHIWVSVRIKNDLNVTAIVRSGIEIHFKVNVGLKMGV